MQALPKSRLFRFVEQAIHLARQAVARYSSKFSKPRYTLHQHIVLLCLRVRKNTTYRILLDELIEMPRIQRAINLEEFHPSDRYVKRLIGSIWLYGAYLSTSQLHSFLPTASLASTPPVSTAVTSQTLHKVGKANDSAVKSHAVG